MPYADLVFTGGPVFTADPSALARLGRRGVRRPHRRRGGTSRRADRPVDGGRRPGRRAAPPGLPGRARPPRLGRAGAAALRPHRRRRRRGVPRRGRARTPARTRTDRGSSAAAGRWRPSRAARRTAALLDAVVADRPVFLPNRDGHGAWVNCRRAGAGRDRPRHPRPGRRAHRAGRRRRSPPGTLHEGAMDLVDRLLAPAAAAEDWSTAPSRGQRYLHSLGDHRRGRTPSSALRRDAATLAGVPDAAAARRGCTARVVGALWWDRGRGVEQIAELVERREPRPRRAGSAPAP